MRPMRRAIGGSEDSSGAAAASAVGATLELAEAEVGIGVTPHGSFSVFVVAAALGSPPGVRDPFTVIIWGTVSVQEVTENVRPSYVVADVEAPAVADCTSPSTLRDRDLSVKSGWNNFRDSVSVRSA